MFQRILIIVFHLSFLANMFAQNDRLIAYYPFSGNADDASGNGFNGVVNGAILSNDRAGQSSRSYAFDGINDYIDIPYDSSFYPASITAAVWINAESLPDSGFYYVLTTSGDNKTPPYDPFRIKLDSTGHIVVRYEGDQDSLQVNMTSATTLNLNEWYFITTYYDHVAGQAALYINGQLEKSRNRLMNLDTNRIGMRIGAGQNHIRSKKIAEFFHGRIDDIRMFSYALSDSEIQDLFNEVITSIADVSPLIPDQASLFQNYPNPFNPETVITYQLVTAGKVELSIFDVVGRKVQSLVNTRQFAGNYEIRWNGRDQKGQKATSGIYFYRLNAGTTVLTRKMILIR